MKRIDQALFTLSLALVVAVSSLITRIAVPTDAPPNPQGIALPIAMYHHILKEPSRLNPYTISPDEFRQDMQFLKDSGYQSVLIRDLIDYVDGEGTLPEKPIMITFDDGYESFYEYAYPILQEMGFSAVYSVIGTYADQYSGIDDHHILYSHCTWNELAMLQKSGTVEIQNHSYNLHVMDRGRHGAKKIRGESDSAYREVLLSDIGKMQDDCREHLDGWLPTAFTYPFGQISEEALPILKELGFQAALTCSEKINYLTGKPEELYHLSRFNRPHGKSLQSILERTQKY